MMIAIFRHRFIILMTLGLSILRGAVALADDPEGAFVRGSEYYEQGDYQAAIAQFQSILDAGLESWEVYYNLGNCYYKQRELARAILNFERARRLSPANDDINHNLQLAKLGIVDRIQDLPSVFIVRWLTTIRDALGTERLMLLTVGFYLLLVGLLIGRIYSTGGRTIRILTILLVIVAVVLASFGGLLVDNIVAKETSEYAIVLANKVDVKSAPSSTATDVFSLHAGVKVQLRERSSDWFEIRLADGKVGWLREEAVEKI